MGRQKRPCSMVDLYWQRYPFRAAADGIHEFDGQVGDWDQASLDEYLRRLSAIKPGHSHDQGLAYLTAQSEQFWYGELGWHTISPMVYLEPVDLSIYLKRDYAPLETRRKAARQHALQVPALLEQARSQLKGPTSASMFRQAAGSAREYADFYRTDLAAFVGEVIAADQLDSFAGWLESQSEKAPDHYSMGPDLFERMLETGQGFSLSAQRLEELARQELDRNLKRGQQLTGGRLAEFASGMASGHPPAHRVVAEATAIVEGLRDFLHHQALVSMPGESSVQVKPSPPGARWSFASMDCPGPFEESEEAFYYVTLPDSDWPAQEQDEWMASFEPGLLHLITLHESFPGHFVHRLHMRQLPQRERKALRSYAFTEGWAHYCEEMMMEVGYQGSVEPLRLQVSQILAALDRCCRLLGSIRLHCAGDSTQHVADLFHRQAFMEPARALSSARRGAFDPEYGIYTLGKLMLLKLKADQPHLSLQQFHDQVLGWGSPPPWLLRRTLKLGGEPL